MKTMPRCLLLCMLIALAPLSFAKSADKKPELSPEESSVLAQLKALQDEVGPAKRDMIKAQLELTPAEEKRFWPVYEEHQNALEALNKRRIDNVLAYSRVYNAGHIEELPADRLVREAIDIEQDEAALLEKSYNKLHGWITPVKLVRYLQIESKLRAFVRVKQAAQVPLAE
jgi:hypothetical protein